MKKTLVFKVNPADPDKKIISECAVVVRLGGIIAFPTETVYGLAANILDKKAIERLYTIKSRPKGKPFTVHIADTEIIGKMGCRLTDKAMALADKFWPGPLTIILKSESGEKIGFRMPANKVALEFISSSKVPLAAPSANISGSEPPKDASGVLKQLDGKIDILIDGGRTDVGIESTVIDMTIDPPNILRQGAIPRTDLAKAMSSFG